MRLLFLSSWYPPESRGGGEISTHLLAQELVRRGHEVLVITEGASAGRSEYQGVPVQRVPVPLRAKPLFERRASRRMARELVRHVPLADFEIIHAHDFRSTLVLGELLRMQRVAPVQAYATVRDYAPICGTTHNILRDGATCHCTLHDLVRTQRYQEAARPRRYARLWQYRYNVRYRTRMFGLVPHHIYISSAEQAVIFAQASYEALRYTVIYNLVPDGYLTAPITAGVGGTVLYVGTVEDYKGVDLLVQAWPEVARHVGGQAQLVIAGGGAQRQAYEQWVERAGLQYCVQFMGKVPWERMQRLYESAQVVVTPHRWVEPFGRTAAEAMALGKIVVSADIGGPAELINNSKNGFVFRHGSAEALAEKLLTALQVPSMVRREIGLAARDTARKLLSRGVIAQQYEVFYESRRAEHHSL